MGKQQVTSLNKVLMLLQVQAQTQVVGAEPADIKAVREEPIQATADDVVFEDVSETSSSSSSKEETTTAVVSKGKKEDKTNDTHLSQAVADYESIVTPSSSRGDVPVVEKASSDLTEDTDPLKEEEAVTPARVAVAVAAATRSIPVAEATPVVATRSVVVPPSPPSPPSSVVVVPVPTTKKKKLPSWNADGAVAGAAAAAGTWKFIESDAAIQRRTSKKKEALFGKVVNVIKSGANELQGDSFGYYWDQMRNDKVTFLGDTKTKAPKWASIVDTDSVTKKKANVRSLLPLLALDGDTKINLKKSKSSSAGSTNNGGVHYLTMKYENQQLKNKDIEAAIIVGEIVFDSTGFVLAQGADWKKLFAGKLQLKAQSTNNKMTKWYSHKVSEPWQDGDTLTFKIDVPKNTIGYTIRGAIDNKVRSGWMFTNVLAYTNNRMNPDYLQIFAYCGGKQSLNNPSKNKSSQYENVKFTIVNAVADDKKKIKN